MPVTAPGFAEARRSREPVRGSIVITGRIRHLVLSAKVGATEQLRALPQEDHISRIVCRITGIVKLL